MKSQLFQNPEVLSTRSAATAVASAEEFDASIRKTLRELRIREDISQQEAADAIGTSQQSIHNIESGLTARLSLSTLHALAKAYKANITITVKDKKGKRVLRSCSKDDLP